METWEAATSTAADGVLIDIFLRNTLPPTAYKVLAALCVAAPWQWGRRGCVQHAARCRSANGVRVEPLHALPIAARGARATLELPAALIVFKEERRGWRRWRRRRWWWGWLWCAAGALLWAVFHRVERFVHAGVAAANLAGRAAVYTSWLLGFWRGRGNAARHGGHVVR